MEDNARQTKPSRHSVRKLNRKEISPEKWSAKLWDKQAKGLSSLSTCTKEDNDKPTSEASSYCKPRLRSKPLIPIHCLVPYAPEAPKRKPRRTRLNRNIRYLPVCSSCIDKGLKKKSTTSRHSFISDYDRLSFAYHYDKIEASITSGGGNRSGRTHGPSRQGVVTSAPRSS